jgi:hypothetical protein
MHCGDKGKCRDRVILQGFQEEEKGQ